MRGPARPKKLWPVLLLLLVSLMVPTMYSDVETRLTAESA